jgi:bacterioferritin-associated ferredoxin
MILCVCNALREADVRSVVRTRGATCPASAYRALGTKPKCGQCVPAARIIVSEERAVAC